MALTNFGSGIPMIMGYDLKAKVPLDYRVLVDSISDLSDATLLKYAYPGLLVYCKEDSSYYTYNGTSFSKFEPGGGGTSDVSVKFGSTLPTDSDMADLTIGGWYVYESDN